MFRRVGSLSASLLYKKTYPKMEEACLEKKVVCKRENSNLDKFKRDMSGKRDLLGEGIILEKKTCREKEKYLETCQERRIF